MYATGAPRLLRRGLAERPRVADLDARERQRIGVPAAPATRLVPRLVRAIVARFPALAPALGAVPLVVALHPLPLGLGRALDERIDRRKLVRVDLVRPDAGLDDLPVGDRLVLRRRFDLDAEQLVLLARAR